LIDQGGLFYPIYGSDNCHFIGATHGLLRLRKTAN